MTKFLPIKVAKIHERAKLPVYATVGSACADVSTVESVMVPAGGTAVISTGLCFEIPDGFCIKAHSRSGHGFKFGVRLANCTGIIDSDYRGELKLKLKNDSNAPLNIVAGERIAQIEVAEVIQGSFVEASTLSTTVRGDGGFGSTGA